MGFLLKAPGVAADFLTLIRCPRGYPGSSLRFERVFSSIYGNRQMPYQCEYYV